MPRKRRNRRQQPRAGELEGASVDDALAALDVDESGLSSAEAERRLAEHGPNAIEEQNPNPLLMFLSYFWGPIPWMLEAACTLSAVGKRWEDFFVIFAMLLINGAVGWWHESRAAKAIEALKAALAPTARALRDGKRQTIDAKKVVPGDVIILRRGDVVPADAKLLDGGLSLDESTLTGESLPIEKDRGGASYTSTTVERGEARALVVATGAATRFGRTVELVAGVADRSHFQKAVLRIGYFLMAMTAALVLVVSTLGLVKGESVMDVLLFALILTVAGIPVALPAVLSVTMAIGARRLAAHRAIVSHLAAMEELAGVDILFSDKTGTLTINQLQLHQPILVEAADREELELAAALTADRSDERDAIDAAVLSAVDASQLAPFTIEEFLPFDSTRKRAESRVSTAKGPSFSVAKGAPQVLLEVCEADEQLRREIARAVDELAEAGYRALGVARRDGQKWRYLGLLSLLDPPRDDSAAVIADARAHGLDVRMVTGDHQAIARQVARQIGLGTKIVPAGDLHATDEQTAHGALVADGFAEVTPEDKYELVARLQRQDRIVAMTGDGVNDAPALKKADVGFAVSAATDAARAAADIVLTRPGLGVIIGAIEEARRIFGRMLSYATFRIAETTRMVVFIAGTIVFLGIYPVTAIMVALLAILNDIPIMTIATDNTPTAREPVRWNMRWVLADASLLGATGVIASVLLLWFARSQLQLPQGELQTLIFLKLLVAGHMTIYVARVRDWFWRRPWPSWKLIVALEATQVLGTLVAVFGWLVTPIPLWLALAVWGYAIVWMVILSAVRVVAFRKLRPLLEPRRPQRAGGGRHPSTWQVARQPPR